MTVSSTTPNPDDSSPSGWLATLDLHLQQRDGRAVLARNRHSGPLRVQKLLQPASADEPAQLLLVHPPGGIAGGDQLRLQVQIDGPTRALITTPGATRWYRSLGARASQEVRLTIGAGAALEWLPQDTIVQEHALARSSLQIELAEQAAFLGWELVQLGQPLALRPWTQGHWTQHFELRRAGRLLLAERGHFTPADLSAHNPQRLASYSVMATLWATGGTLASDPAVLLSNCRAILETDQNTPAGISWLEPPTGCVVVRLLGHDAQLLRQRMSQLWSLLRPVVIGCPTRTPRIWAT